MASDLQWLRQELFSIYDRNPYVKLLDMSIASIDEGQTELKMPIIDGKHTNLYNIAHGGVLASMADTAMGAACATLGKRVVTMEMNMNFIKGAVPQAEIRAIGKVLHNGRNTMIVESEIVDGANCLLAKGRGTFFVVGVLEKKNA